MDGPGPRRDEAGDAAAGDRAAFVAQRRLRDAASRRSTSPITRSAGTRASVRKTSQNGAVPFMTRSGRTSTPAWCMSMAK